MNRFQNQSSADAFSLMKYLYENKEKISVCKPTPTFKISANKTNNTEISFSVSSLNFETQTTVWNYGDKTTDTRASHVYKTAGNYLVSCTKTNLHDVSKIDWIFVSLGK